MSVSLNLFLQLIRFRGFSLTEERTTARDQESGKYAVTGLPFNCFCEVGSR